MSDSVRIGVSACLLGESVRHDASHANHVYLVNVLSKQVELVPLCPEMGCGMGLPREAVRHVDCAGDLRLIGADSAEDWTERMNAWCDRVIPDLENDDLCGFVVKDDSPTCGSVNGPVHSTDSTGVKRGVGFFTARLMKRFPLMPVESQARLDDPILRENFIRRIFVYKRWLELLAGGKTIGRLVDFHTRHKLLIRAYDLKGYRELGHLLGESSMDTVDAVFDAYGARVFKALSLKSTPKKNSDVLMHAMGYFKKDLDDGDKRELLGMINGCKGGKLPLLVPATLLNHFARKYERPYLSQQYYLNPHPLELKLLNRV